MDGTKIVDLGMGKAVKPAILYASAVQYDVRPAAYAGEPLDKIQRCAEDLASILPQRYAHVPEHDWWICDCGHRFPDSPQVTHCPFCGVEAKEDEPEGNGESTALVSRVEADKMIAANERKRHLEECKTGIRQAALNNVRNSWLLGGHFHDVQRLKLYQLDGETSFRSWVERHTPYSHGSADECIRWHRTISEDMIESFCRLGLRALAFVVREVRGMVSDGEDTRGIPLYEERQRYRPVLEMFVPEIKSLPASDKPVSQRQIRDEVLPGVKGALEGDTVEDRAEVEATDVEVEAAEDEEGAVEAQPEPELKPESSEQSGAPKHPGKAGRPKKPVVAIPEPVPAERVDLPGAWMPSFGHLPYRLARSGRPNMLTAGQILGKIGVIPIHGTGKIIRLRFDNDSFYYQILDEPEHEAFGDEHLNPA